MFMKYGFQRTKTGCLQEKNINIKFMIMKWLKRLFGKKEKKLIFNEKGKYKLLIIDEDAELMHQNLGINDVRAEELLKLCLDSFEKNKCLHTAMKDVVDNCIHTNEIVFTSFMMSKILNTNEQRNRLHDMLKDMFGNG